MLHDTWKIQVSASSLMHYQPRYSLYLQCSCSLWCHKSVLTCTVFCILIAESTLHTLEVTGMILQIFDWECETFFFKCISENGRLPAGGVLQLDKCFFCAINVEEFRSSFSKSTSSRDLQHNEVSVLCH